MKRSSVIALCLFIAMSGCHVETYMHESGIKYMKAQMGLGVGDDSGKVPNALEVDIPVMNMHVESPVLTEIAKAVLAGTGSILDWSIGGLAELLGIGGD